MSRRRRNATISRACMIEQLETRRLLAVDLSAVGIWQERGPGSIDEGQAEADYGIFSSSLDDPVSGGVEALAPHPTNKNILYVGTVNGGVWRTTDAYDEEPKWTPLTDQLPSLSIGALAFSPMDATDQTLYA